GHYCESGQVIPVRLGDEQGGYVHSMYLNDHPPIAAGRELWGFPKKLGDPELRVHKDTLVGTLDYSDFRVATGTMGFKHQRLDAAAAATSLAAGALDLHAHALAPVAALPVLEVISAVHILADLTLPLGTVVHDYLA
ncbi:MAG: acetoacetate decarboxylase, partial [Betaproteobacteria bacterium]